jgi:hypothetical protein
LGKIDNDLIVPKGWMTEILKRLEHAQQDKLGPVTMYHWPREWSRDLNPKNMPVYTTVNGTQLVRSSHTGGNYLMHRYLYDKLGPTPINDGLKGGFGLWQQSAGPTMICGYVYPLQFFKLPEMYDMMDAQKRNSLRPATVKFLEKERLEAKRLLELTNGAS